MEWRTLLSSDRIGQQQLAAAQARSAFEQDYDRIIFSHPFRRLQDKTQVHPLPEYDFVHTRLTHSLEVSSVGRSLGRIVGEAILEKYPSLKEHVSAYDFGTIVAAASLSHDLGNPPFGHAAEEAISDFFETSGKRFQENVTAQQWKDLTTFEGNAQGFRILNKNQYGLKLTYATLGAFMKYPCPSLFPTKDKSKRSQKKFGFFESEQSIFEQVATSLGLTKNSEVSWQRHPLAFLVEAADDICYSIIDLEDGCNLGLVSYDEAELLLTGVLSKNKTKLGKLASIHTQAEKIGYLRALAISDLMYECASLFLEKENEILAGIFDVALADACPSAKALKAIIDVSIKKIYKARQVVEIEAAGHEVLPGLLEEFTKAGEYMLWEKSSRKYQNLQQLFPADIAHAILQQRDTYTMLRYVIDFISGLTDRHALSLYRKIKGMSL
jgi:dGTPase